MIPVLYFEGEFLALVATSLLLPATIFTWLIRKRTMSRRAIALVALGLIAISGVDAVLLERLGTKAKTSTDPKYSKLFASEFSIALYLLPLVMAGIGINLLTHLLCEHLVIAELNYDKEEKEP